MTTIKDIYIGKPDARDEVEFDDKKAFLQSYIVPPNFDIESLITGNKCFINGYKGTGKTALLYYIDNEVKLRDESACTSFIFFKEQFNNVKRKNMDILLKKMHSCIEISNNIPFVKHDYEYIWRWMLFKKIVSDNEEFNCGLFVDNKEWQTFLSLISKIMHTTENKHHFIEFPSKIKMAIPYIDSNSGMILSPEVELDFSNKNNDKEYYIFISMLDQATVAFEQLTRSDIPYYIFVDEVEAYFSELVTFKRDLSIIRDLIFTVKHINLLLKHQQGGYSKIICSVRTEIINSISRFISPKELNKTLSGFESLLQWDYNNSNSYAHPIMQILLRRIEIAENRNEIFFDSMLNVYNKWFPENVDKINPVDFILNNSWSKPRDIVRLLEATQTCLNPNSEYFSQAVFQSSLAKYSRDSLEEIKEELQAIYSSEEISKIFLIFTGFKTVFRKEDLEDHIKNDYPRYTDILKKLDTILSDLYRLGVIGNLASSGDYRFEHKGNHDILLTSEWKICVHRGLLKALSVNKRNDRSQVYIKQVTPEPGMPIEATVTNVFSHGLILSTFSIANRIYYSCQYQVDWNGYFAQNGIPTVGQTLTGHIKYFNSKYKKWVIEPCA